MPVVGHAFAGLATAMQFGPASAREPRQPTAVASALWAPAVVATSYFPDIVTQIGGALGASHANYYGHQPAVGAAAGIVLGGLWSLAAGTPALRAMAIAVGCILGHDVLDLIQSTDWAWNFRIVQDTVFGLSPRVVSEAIVSACLFAVFLAWHLWTGRWQGPLAKRTALGRWMPRAIVAVILLAAVGTYVLRGQNERQLNEARKLLEGGRYVDALQMADRADGWPRGNRPGRIDVIRAEAHEHLGHYDLAEKLLIRAYEEDPTNFWALADLAECYASSSSGRPPAERRRLTESTLTELRQRFARHPSLHSVLVGIERELSRADPAE
jgi:hypothetical protein